MKIIQIKNTTQGEIAYLYDEQRGRVIKVFVEDLTGADIPAPEQYEDEPPRRRRKESRVLRADELDDLPDLPEPKRPAGPPPTSIVPPHLAGVFRQPGTPGAAEESRMV